MKIYLQKIGLCASGLRGWSNSVNILRGLSAWNSKDSFLLKPKLLPVNEQRRVTPLIKLALMAAEDALQGESGFNLSSVFASSIGDSEIADKLCTLLSLPEKPVSPILFYQSVYNAPAGCWNITMKVTAASNSIAANETSFSAALLASAVQVISEKRDVFMLVYDQATPPTLRGVLPIEYDFASAFWLSYQETKETQAQLTIKIETNNHKILQENPNKPQFSLNPTLLALHQNNPSAQALPLLSLLANQTSNRLSLNYLNNNQLIVDVTIINQDNREKRETELD